MKRPIEPTPAEWRDPNVEQFNKKVRDLSLNVLKQAALLKTAIDASETLLTMLDNPVINKAANAGDPQTVAIINKGRDVVKSAFAECDVLEAEFDRLYAEGK